LSGYSIKSAGGIKYISFNIFSDTGFVRHAFTTRLGGVSQGPFRSLNLATHVGDHREAVLENRAAVCAALGFGLDEMVAGQQVHGKRVYVVTGEDRGRGAADSETAIPETDALITNVPGILLSSYYADCVPVMLLDPVKKAVGLVHAGWKGTAMRIACAALAAMSEAFGTDPIHCLAAIAPSIGDCCYEVDRPLVDAFNQYGFDPGPFLKQTGENRWRLDLCGANRHILEESGVRPGNIAVTGLCAACSPELFFSYRRSGSCGRMASLMALV